MNSKQVRTTKTVEDVSEEAEGRIGAKYLFEQHGLADAGGGIDVAIDPLCHEVRATHLPVVWPRVHRLNRQCDMSAALTHLC